MVAVGLRASDDSGREVAGKVCHPGAVNGGLLEESALRPEDRG